MSLLESQYQASVIKKVKDRLPGCQVIKNDSGYQQGIPDWTIFYNNKWGMLEIKASLKSSKQPNQEYFVEHMNEMSFAAVVYPENEGEVLNALQAALES